MIRYHARWIVPISSAPVENGTVAVDRGRIAYVGPRAEAPAGTDHELGDSVLLPGLVNVHTHLELTAYRGLLDGLSFRDWIVSLNASKTAAMSRERFLDSARLGVAEGLRHGVTTFADTTDSGAPMDALIESGARGVVYQEVFGPDPRQCDESMRGLRDKVGALRERATHLVAVGVSPHAPYTVSDALFQATVRFAGEHRLPVAIHIAESEVESALVQRAEGEFAEGLRKRGIDVSIRGRTPIALLDRLGVLDVSPLLIHCVRVDPSDIARMAATDCAVAHCPISNAKLGHGVAPLVEMLASGLRVGLGSDSVASNDAMRPLEEARVAVLAQRASRQDHCGMNAAAVLRLATLGGAEALGMAHEIGSLEPGKSADLAAFPLGDVVSAADPASTLVYTRGGAAATLVAVAGDVLVRDGCVLREDPALVSRVSDTAQRLSHAIRMREELLGKA